MDDGVIIRMLASPQNSALRRLQYFYFLALLMSGAGTSIEELLEVTVSHIDWIGLIAVLLTAHPVRAPIVRLVAFIREGSLCAQDVLSEERLRTWLVCCVMHCVECCLWGQRLRFSYLTWGL